MANMKDARKDGYARGYNIASWTEIPSIGDEIPRHLDWVGYRIVDADNQADVWSMLVGEAESANRDFSPFEFTAHAFNESSNSEGLWEAFDAGIQAGIAAYYRKHIKRSLAA